MPEEQENKQVDGIKKLTKKDIEKSRKLVLDEIDNEIEIVKKQQEATKKTISLSVDSIIKPKRKEIIAPELLKVDEIEDAKAEDQDIDKSKTQINEISDEEQKKIDDERKRQQDAIKKQQILAKQRKEELKRIENQRRIEAEKRILEEKRTRELEIKEENKKRELKEKYIKEKKEEDEGRRKHKEQEVKKENQRIIQEQQKEESKRKKEEKIKQQKNRKEKINEFRKNLRFKTRLYTKKILNYFVFSLAILIFFYLFFVLIILKINPDNKKVIGITKVIKVPAVITNVGMIDFSYFKQLEARTKEQCGGTDCLPELRANIAEDLIINYLANKYGISREQTNFTELLNEMIFKDKNVNQVAINRIEKIDEMIRQGGNFVEVANKYADRQDQVDFENAETASIKFGESVVDLAPGEISGIINRQDGYYILRRYEKEFVEYAFSYVYIKGKSLNDYLNEEMQAIRLWSLVKIN